MNLSDGLSLGETIATNADTGGRGGAQPEGSHYRSKEFAAGSRNHPEDGSNHGERASHSRGFMSGTVGPENDRDRDTQLRAASRVSACDLGTTSRQQGNAASAQPTEGRCQSRDSFR
jgi:hypothetical protein